jgi:transketolase
MKLPVVYVATHDSIGLGEDGATHQPAEQLASLRIMPNLCVLRPADFTETLECWYKILSEPLGPHLVSLSRGSLPQISASLISDELRTRGGYLICDKSDGANICDAVIFATGSEVSLAIEVADKLYEIGYKIKVLSLPIMQTFLNMQPNYNLKSRLKIGIEAGCSLGWDRLLYLQNGDLFFGVESFGASADPKILYTKFGLTTEVIAEKILSKLKMS